MPRYFIVVLGFVLLVLASIAQDKQSSVAMNNDSDWWSITRDGGYSWPGVDEQAVSTDPSNFEILGVSLKEDDPERHLAANLGNTASVVRGDAATSRNQYCYISKGSSTPIYLVFESGEVQSTFYIFSRASDWDGSQRCEPSSLINSRLSTSSGLRLGLTRPQVEAILGKPTAVQASRVAYVRAVRVKSSPEELRRYRAQNPAMPESEFQSNFAYYDQSTYIEARFKNSRVVYLALSESETF